MKFELNEFDRLDHHHHRERFPANGNKPIVKFESIDLNTFPVEHRNKHQPHGTEVRASARPIKPAIKSSSFKYTEYSNPSKIQDQKNTLRAFSDSSAINSTIGLIMTKIRNVILFPLNSLNKSKNERRKKGVQQRRTEKTDIYDSKLDACSRFLFPTVFLLFNCLYWVFYLLISDE